MGEGWSPAAPRVPLRQSRVRTTRLGRLLQYGELAARIGAGAVSHSLRNTLAPESAAPASRSLSDYLSSEECAELVVDRVARMRGAALKLGQMLGIQAGALPASDSDANASTGAARLTEIFLRVQNRADMMPARQLEAALAAELGSDWRKTLFTDFEMTPLAAASIGQVHRACVAGDQAVAVKVQYPHIDASIDADLDNLRRLATATGFIPRGAYLENAVRVARRELRLETNYLREAQWQMRFRTALQEMPMNASQPPLATASIGGPGHNIRFTVPRVHAPPLTTRRVLTMDFVGNGSVPLGSVVTASAAAPSWARDTRIRQRIARALMWLCFEEVFGLTYMQTDPNWANFMVRCDASTTTNTDPLIEITLLDFGSARAYKPEFLAMYANLLECAVRGDAEGVERWSCKVGLLTGLEAGPMRQAHVRAVLLVGEAFAKSTGGREYDFGEHGAAATAKVKSLIPILLEHRLSPPPDEIYSLHRKISGIYSLCTMLGVRLECAPILEMAISRFRAKFGSDGSKGPRLDDELLESEPPTSSVGN